MYWQIHYDEIKNAVHHSETNDNKHILSHLNIEHNGDNLTRFWFLVRMSLIGSFEPNNEIHPKNIGQ